MLERNEPLTKLYEHRKANWEDNLTREDVEEGAKLLTGMENQKVFEEIKQPVMVYGGKRREGKTNAIMLFEQRRKEQTAK